VTRRDRAVVAVLLVLLGALSIVVVMPPLGAGAVPSPSPSVAAVRPYREGLVGEPTSVSPFGGATAADRALIALTFSGLVALGPDGTIVPGLAARWTADPSGASYTFELRPDARWQDGQPVTAHDVEFTFGVLKDPAYTGPGAGSWGDVVVTVLDPRTVRFELANPIAGFMYAATQPIAPAHLLEGVSPEALATDPFGQQPVGSGPYRLVSWNAGEATLEAVRPTAAPQTDATPPVDSLVTPAPTPHYPGPYLPRIEFRFSTDPEVLAAAYRAGDLDAVSGLPPALAAQLGSEAGTRLLRYPGSTLSGIVLDLRAGRRDFRDPRARLGLLEALDRDAIVRGALAGLATRADAPVPPTSWGFDPTVSRPVRPDLAAAARDLAAAGWRRVANGWLRPGAKTVVPIRLLCPDSTTGPVGRALAEAVAAGWRAIGLTVEVVALPPAELVAKHLRPGDFDAAVLDIALGLDPDLYPILAASQTIGGGSNVSGLQDPVLDPKLLAARRPGPDADRRAAWRDLQAYLATHTFLLPIAFRDEVVVARSYLVGPVVQPVGDASDRFYDVLTWRLAVDR
jgi:peptide/nickel transport system substrate-binding protein